MRRRRRQAEGSERSAPALIGGGAGQRGRTDGIAGREYAGNIGLEALVHLHVPRALIPSSKPLQADAVQIRDASERREHDVRASVSPPRSRTST